MNYQCSNGNTIISSKENRMTTINGIKYPWVKGMKGNCISSINEKTYIDGYELKNGKWKKTLAGLWNLIF